MITEIFYLILGLFGGYIFGIISPWGLSILNVEHLVHWRGFHFHHSFFGLLALILVSFCKDNSNILSLLIGFSLGAIFQHTIKEGFIFVTKD